MAIEWHTEENNLMVYTVSGQLGISEMNQAVGESSQLLVGDKVWKVLVLLRDFTGWSREEGWENASLVDDADESISGMALVGPREWQDQVEMFTLKGMRPLDIEYFNAEDDARAWLGV